MANLASNFEGHDPRECGEHRTVGPHRAWCYDCGEWCYPNSPCVRCEVAALRKQSKASTVEPSSTVGNDAEHGETVDNAGLIQSNPNASRLRATVENDPSPPS